MASASTLLRQRYVYLVLCLVGVLVPYWQFVPWFLDHGLDIPVFAQQLFANRIGAFFGLDVFVSSLVLWIFVFAEGSRLGMRRLWIPVIGTLLVGVSLGLPLFLYMRQLHLDKATI
jgi:Terpene cyclase DEP1